MEKDQLNEVRKEILRELGWDRFHVTRVYSVTYSDQVSSFTTPLQYENIDGVKLRLTRAFTYHVGDEHSDEFITVPSGFECDGQSYPRLLRFIDTPQGRGAKAGFIHDYLYFLNGRPVPNNGRCYDREAADKIYREALEVSGVNPISRAVRYRALRIFGRFAWNAHARRIRELQEGLALVS